LCSALKKNLKKTIIMVPKANKNTSKLINRTRKVSSRISQWIMKMNKLHLSEPLKTVKVKNRVSVWEKNVTCRTKIRIRMSIIKVENGRTNQIRNQRLR